MREWKDVVGFEGFYKVSNDGIVIRIGKVSNQFAEWESRRILKPSKDKDGYLQVSLCRPGIKPKPYKIHRLVAIAFIPNPMGLPQVNHKDNGTDNNNVENLEWCTPKYNRNYGTCGVSQREKVAQYDLNNNLIKVWDYINGAANELEISASHIVKCCKGKIKSAYGFRWSYV